MDIDLNKPLDGEQENQEESELDEEEIRTKGDWTQQLQKACQKGDYDHAKKCIDKKANIFVEDKKKWTPLTWASCKGYVEIVRLLIIKGASSNYNTIQNNQSMMPNFAQTAPLNQHSNQDDNNPNFAQTQPFNPSAIQQKKVIMGQINTSIKQTPLQWACFKGHINIVYLLLKAGLSWEDVDPFGNNCVHLAASGGSLIVFQALLLFGVTVDQQNARGHNVKDLATNRDIIILITQLETNVKENPQKRYWCMTCKDYFCIEDYRLEWMFETDKSTDKEKPEGRCNQCWQTIENNTDQLMDIIQKQDHKLLTDKLNQVEAQRIEIDLKSLDYAKVQQEKLKTQNQIIDFINGLKIVENYKTIMKSVNTIRDMLEDAQKRNVLIDQQVIDLANEQMARLISERNLRFELDNLAIGEAIPEQVQNLQDKMSDAQEKGVNNEYIDDAEVLKEKMARSIQAKKFLKMFTEYPFREYPDPIQIDPKTKKPIDPITKKPIDPLKLAQQNQKKKKRREPKFLIPEWATDIKILEENVKSLEALLKDQETLKLSNQFIGESQDQLKRMKNEIRYRKQIDEELRLIAEAKAAAKKKR